MAEPRASVSSDSGQAYPPYAVRLTSTSPIPPRRSSVGSGSILDPFEQQLRDRADAAASTANSRSHFSFDARRSLDPFGARLDTSDPGNSDMDLTSRPRSRASFGSGRSARSGYAGTSSGPAGHHHDFATDPNPDEEDDGGFVPKRKDRHPASSILPPAGFFAPKKPNTRPGATSPIARERSRSPFAQLDEAATSAAPPSTESMQHHPHQPIQPAQMRSRSLRTIPNDSSLSLQGDLGVRSTRPSSPWGFSGSVQSLSSSTYLGSIPVDREREQDPHSSSSGLEAAGGRSSGSGPWGTPAMKQSLKLATSTDPLLPAAAIRGANPGRGSDLGSLEFIQQSLSKPSLRAYEEQSYTVKGRNPHRQDRASEVANGSRSPSGVSNGGRHSPARVPRDTSSVSISMPATSLPRKRNYTHHGGSNRFFLGGLIMTSGGNPLWFLGSLALVLVLGGLFFGFEASWLVYNVSPATVAMFGYVYLLTLVNMLVTAWKDPGIVPRDLDPDPPCTLGEAGPYQSQPFADPGDPLAIPVQRVIRIRGEDVRVKWCETCGTYRPPRSSHCRVCDNCVENIDHHCDFLNTCIGRRNYVSFMVFLTAAILAALMVLAFTVLHLVFLTRPSTFTYPRGQAAPDKNFREALGDSPVSAVLFILTLATLGPIATLFFYHVRLIVLNRTTVEQIRISTAREFGEKTYEDTTHDDVDSVYAAAGPGGPPGGNPISMCCWATLAFCGVKKPDDRRRREKDPNPFATKQVRKNVRNGMGWRSVGLESWIDRRGWHVEDTRRENPAVRRSGLANAGGGPVPAV